MTRPKRLNVAVFGGSAYPKSDPVFKAAAALGGAVARRGWTVVNGGYGGVMLASAQGAVEAGGLVIGVTCAIFKSKPNEYITEEIRTNSLFERLQKIIELGDAYVVMPGSTGTLAELALVWELVNKAILPARPILCWGDFWRPVVRVFEADDLHDERIPALARIDKPKGDLIAFVNTAEAAVEILAGHLEPAPH